MRRAGHNSKRAKRPLANKINVGEGTSEAIGRDVDFMYKKFSADLCYLTAGMSRAAGGDVLAIGNAPVFLLLCLGTPSKTA